ncbi:hypothetical protein AGDE_12608 [Angomonas deanei]|nr:hypothetical protein AGDE_12608 [Angomonas deanei]|eukprot:EPY23954.1 hypothetical protein AGDE_12608 [Angomonas deanei]
MFVYTDNHENNTIGMHIPHRPLSAYDRYITQLREQNFFNGSTHSALYMLDDNTNNNNNAKEDEVVTFFQQSSLSPIMEEFLRWKEEMAFFTANRNHQNNKNDKTAAQYFSPLQMKEGNGNFPKKDGNKDQTIQSRMTANTPQRCSICEKEFSFLKKSVFCSLCFRNVCSSCLHAIEITDTSNNNVALMALADKSNKLLTTFQKIMTDLQNKKNNNDKEIEFAKYFPKSFYTTIENISNENTDEEKTAESSECFYNTIPSLDVSTHPNRTVTSNSSVSVSACPDCARTVLLLNLEYQTIFIPQRMFQSVLFYPNPNHHNEIKMESIRNGTQSESLPPMSEAVKTASVVVEEQEGEEEKEMTANTNENEVSTPIKEDTVAVEDMPSPTPAVPTTEEEQTEHYIIYKGYLSKGLPHLYGELWWTTTNPLTKEKGPSYHYYYSGSFYEGKRHGYGVLVYDSDHHRNGERYEGNFSHNYFEGKHNYYFCADGSVLEGDFHRNRLTSINYYGETEKVENGKYNNNNNIRHGRGIYFYNVRNLKTQRRAQPLNSHNVSLDFTVSPGTVYNGEWQKGIRHGSGMLLFFVKRVREILGDATLPNNHNTFYELTRIFRGTLQQNALNGKGLLQEGKDSFYYGDFSDNMKNGKGVEFFYHKDFVNRHAEMSIHELFENSSKLYKDNQNKELLFSRIYESTFQHGLVHGYCKQYTFFSHPSEKQYPFSIYETSYHSGSERDDCYDIQLLVDDNASTACCNCQKGLVY